MKKHVATGMVLTGALAAYSAGFAGLGGSLFLVGFALEMWFWLRLVK
jgi:hypothetical protein